MPWTAVNILPVNTAGWWTSSSWPLSRSGLETRAFWSRTCWGPCSGPNSRPGLCRPCLPWDALLMKADAQVLGKDLPEWLDQVSTVLPAEAEFLSEMGRRVDPVGSGLLEENSVLSTGESLASRALVDHLWEMAPLFRTGPAL